VSFGRHILALVRGVAVAGAGDVVAGGGLADPGLAQGDGDLGLR